MSARIVNLPVLRCLVYDYIQGGALSHMLVCFIPREQCIRVFYTLEYRPRCIQPVWQCEHLLFFNLSRAPHEVIVKKSKISTVIDVLSCLSIAWHSTCLFLLQPIDVNVEAKAFSGLSDSSDGLRFNKISESDMVRTVIN